MRYLAIALLAGASLAVPASAQQARGGWQGRSVPPGAEPFRAPPSGGWQRPNPGPATPPANLPPGVETGPQRMGGGYSSGWMGNPAQPQHPRPNPQQPGWTGGPGPVWHNSNQGTPPARTGGGYIAGQPNGGLPWRSGPGGSTRYNNGGWTGGPGPVWHNSNGNGGQQYGSRWGGKVSGRWQGGWNAPGGWNAYRRPTRGWTLPSYWFAGSFFIPDYWSYGLVAPPQGYRWVRYYDDAVLADDRGRVWDSVGGVAWDDDYGAGYEQPGSAIGYVDPNAPYYGDGYAAADGSWGGGPPPAAYAPPAELAPPAPCVAYCQGGAVRSYSYSSGYAGGYYYGAPVTTVVTVQSAPVVTTTVTEEIIEESAVTTYRAPVRRAKRVYRPRPKPCCACGC